MEDTDSQYTGGAESGTPYVSLRRTYTILLLVYGLGAVFALLAGAALTWHVDPYSECLLYSHPVRDRIEYGHEASEYLFYYSWKRRSTRRFAITEKAPTMAFSWLKAARYYFSGSSCFQLHINLCVDLRL